MRLTIPNQLTILRIALTPVFLILFLEKSLTSQFIATIIYLIASLTDWYDGWYARHFGVVTRWGQFMDPLADKFLVSSAMVIFAWLDYTKWWMVWVIVGRDVLVTIIRIYAIHKGTPIVTSTIAKWKTVSQMVVTALILLYVNWLNFYGPGSASYQSQYFDVIGIAMLSVTGFTIASAVLYFYENWLLLWRMMKSISAFIFRRG